MNLHEAWEDEVAHFLDIGMTVEAAWRKANASVPGHDSDTCPTCLEEEDR